jgi:tetratricopeptide (TPR) repeat protein
MEPSYEQIAELFALGGVPTDGVEPTAMREGRDADESTQLGRASLSDGNVENAIGHFKRAIQQGEGSSSEQAMLDLAGAYEYADRAPQAYRQYLNAVKSRHDNPEPFVGIAELHRRQGRFRDAITHLESALQVEPESHFLWFKLAELFRSMGEPKRALAAVLVAVEKQPEESFYHYWTGDLLISMERYVEALEALRAAIELSPGDDFLYQRVAVAFWKLDRRVEAVKAIRLASDLDPDKNLYHGILEELLEAMDQPAEAELESDRADRMDRFDRDIMERLLAEMGI